MVCRWSQSQEGDWARPHLCKLARHRLAWPVRKRFIRDHAQRGRLKPGCQIVGSVTIVWLTTEADDQSSLHCVTVSTDVVSDHIGRRDASRGGGCSKSSAYTGQFGWASKISSILSVDLREKHQQWYADEPHLVWVLPPQLPLFSVVGRDGDVADRCVKPHVEHLQPSQHSPLKNTGHFAGHLEKIQDIWQDFRSLFRYTC